MMPTRRINLARYEAQADIYALREAIERLRVWLWIVTALAIGGWFR